MVNKKELYEFFREMTSQGVAGFAPENMTKVVDISEEDSVEEEKYDKH